MNNLLKSYFTEWAVPSGICSGAAIFGQIKPKSRRTRIGEEKKKEPRFTHIQLTWTVVHSTDGSIPKQAEKANQSGSPDAFHLLKTKCGKTHEQTCERWKPVLW